MNTYPLHFKNGHIFIELDGKLWLFDTGAPMGFGNGQTVDLAGTTFNIEREYFGLNAEVLSGHVDVECAGLLGADVINCFDSLIDIPQKRIIMSSGELDHDGVRVPLEEFMGIPIVTVSIGGEEYPMFFDTGAQISYFQDESIEQYPAMGAMADFFPNFGAFETETYQVPVTVSGLTFELRCGSLPGMLGMTLMMADTQGIIGNDVMVDRVVGYFPRRELMFL